MPSSVVVVAAVQAAPVYLNLERSLTRALDLIAEAARRRAQLVAFPETWLPGYPAWLDVCRDVAVWDHQPTKRLYAHLVEQSVTVPGPVTEALGAAAREHSLTVVMGVNERVIEGAGRGTLYNTILTFGPTGELLNRHRKLVPTFNERLVWGQGDGSTLRSVATPAGRVGSLICWEHWMPLVRQTMHVAGEDIHIAQWPCVKEMYQIAARHYAFEGRCFVISVGGIMRKQDLPRDLEIAAAYANDDSQYILNGGSAIIGPDGQYIAGPAFDSEVILLARINLERIHEENLTLDVTGHFHRPELFEFDYRPPLLLNGRVAGTAELPAPARAEALPPASAEVFSVPTNPGASANSANTTNSANSTGSLSPANSLNSVNTDNLPPVRKLAAVPPPSTENDLPRAENG